MSLYLALIKGKYTKARRLIRRRADINTPGDDGVTPLMLSAQHPDKVELTGLLLLAGAEVNACNNFSETALMLASYNPNNLENVFQLIENGADFSRVSVYGYLARDFALYCHSGLYIFESFDDGVTFDRFFPENSVRREIRKKAKAANAAGLEKLCQEQSIDDNLLSIILRDTIFSEDIDKMEILLKLGVPADSPSIYGDTALSHAAMRANLELVKLLLRYGANPAYQNRHRVTALWAMKNCFPGLQATELILSADYALKLLGKKRMKEIAADKCEIKRLLVEGL